MAKPKQPGGADSDRRHNERIPINSEFGRLDGTDVTWVSDLSEGGVFIHCREQLPIGSTLELRFTVLLEDPMVVEVVGTVARHSQDPLGMGIAFTGMSGDMLARIEDVLARWKPRDPGQPIANAPIEARGMSARRVPPPVPPAGGKPSAFKPPPAPPRRTGR